MPQLPCLIPLFDHQDRSLTTTLHCQQKLVEVGSRGQPLFNDEALDPKTAQLLDIQNGLVDCCAKLARYMAPTPPDLHPAPRGPVASQDPVPHTGSPLTQLQGHSSPPSSPTKPQDNCLPVEQLGKGKGKSQQL
ncbi:hypothetical protein VP01_68g9 [Puccinia sorghi]|uniref:Uncharacterized protein n=1 Tax=Puccinia sorghi TaxID=27349 RepID=A0A0L6UE84_9BASI|nr:hypothetical protein VP01_68g9 [Puccinia sorghi]